MPRGGFRGKIPAQVQRGIGRLSKTFGAKSSIENGIFTLSMRIYLDNCCFNRPFDDQSQLRILLESEAKLKIQEDIRSDSHELIWSFILDYENNKNPFQERREQITKWRAYSITDIVEDEEILSIARRIKQKGIKKVDSLHIACAIKGRAMYFLTTDDGLLKKAALIQELRIIDPIEFIKEVPT